MGRDNFLKNIWQAYPAAPRGNANTGGESTWILGRWERKAGTFNLLRQGERTRQSIVLPEEAQILACKEELSLQSFLSVLRTGDWVAYRPAYGEGPAAFLLLAPNLEANDSGHEPLRQGFLQRGPLGDLVFAFEDFKEKLAQHFRQEGFRSIKTPSLVPCPGTEIFLDVFKTEFVSGSERRSLYLPTSPELHLKKALALGEERIFELKPVFRNGEISSKHQPEFHMLEWYRAFSDLEDIKADCVRLLRAMTGQADLEFASVSVADLFAQLGLELKPETSREELQSWCQRLGVYHREDDLWDDLFYRIFVDRIEAFLPTGYPLFVEFYPPSQAALARVNEQGWAERFELYWRGLEIANAYHELNDPAEQRRRSEADNQMRLAVGRPEVPLDEEFFAALESGMPPSAGIALGVERLYMALTQTSEISELMAFPLSK